MDSGQHIVNARTAVENNPKTGNFSTVLTAVVGLVLGLVVSFTLSVYYNPFVCTSVLPSI